MPKPMTRMPARAHCWYAAERVAPVPPRFDQAGRPEAADVPAHERLGQPDVLGEVRHAGMPECETLDNAQPVDVGERLVDQAELAQLLRLVNDGRDGRPDPGAGWRQWGPRERKRA